MLEKYELVERMICSCYTGEMPKESYQSIFETLMGTSDKELIEDLEKHGLHYEKIGNYFICNN